MVCMRGRARICIVAVFLCLSYHFPLSLRFRIRDCLAQLYAKDITPDDKQELDEALQREVNISIL